MNSLEQLYFLVGKLEALKGKSIKFNDLSFVLDILEENEYFQNIELTEDEFDEDIDSYIDDYDPSAEYRDDFNSRVNWDIDLDQQGDIW